MRQRETERNLELYLHIPFCVKKCAYCDFLSFPAGESTREAYVKALCREIRETGRNGRNGNDIDDINDINNRKDGDDRKDGTDALRVATLFFGGGTPSVLEPDQIGGILQAVRESFQLAPDAEISLEANPGTLTGEKLRAYRRFGINRLSLGLQSADPEELRLLGRIHTYPEFLRNFREAREAGFSNINVDLMSALPGQSLMSWEKTLRQIAELSPEHISAYSLIVEEGTPFYERYGEDESRREAGEEPLFLPSEETEREMYAAARRILKEYGYERYEISNYAKPGYACRHNTGYWTGVPYLGFGLGASSYTGERRYANTASLSEYLSLYGKEERDRSREALRDEPGEEREREEREKAEPAGERGELLTEQEKKEEFFFLGLRMTAGVQEEEYLRRFGESWDREFGKAMERLIRDGYLEKEKGWLRLTEKGVDVSNQVFAELL